MTAAANNLESGNVASYKAGGAITAGYAVKYDTTEGQVVVVNAITDIAIGVALSTVASGDMVDIQVNGVAKMVAGAAVTLGAEVMPLAAGGGKITTASGAGGTARVLGIAESAAGGNGEMIRVRLKVPALGGPVNV